MTESNVQIGKLTAKSWHSWKLKMTHLLKSKKCWGIVNGTMTDPGHSASTRSKEDYQEKQELAHSTLILGISDELTYLVSSCASAEEVWRTLRNHFEKSSLMNKFYLRKRFFRMELKEDQSVMERSTHCNWRPTIRRRQSMCATWKSPVELRQLCHCVCHPFEHYWRGISSRSTRLRRTQATIIRGQ